MRHATGHSYTHTGGRVGVKLDQLEMESSQRGAWQLTWTYTLSKLHTFKSWSVHSPPLLSLSAVNTAPWWTQMVGAKRTQLL